jgi:hypothetical protein
MVAKTSSSLKASSGFKTTSFSIIFVFRFLNQITDKLAI